VKGLLLLALMACGGSDSAPDAVPAADAPLACSLLGSFESGDLGGGRHNVVEFRTDGFYVRMHYAGGTETGAFSADGQSVTLTDQLGDPASLTCPNPGAYSFQFPTGCGKIFFMATTDDCLARKSVLDKQTLTRI